MFRSQFIHKKKVKWTLQTNTCLKTVTWRPSRKPRVPDTIRIRPTYDEGVTAAAMMLAAMEGTEDALARAEGRPSPREHQSSAKAGSNHPNAKRSGTAKTLPNRFICNPLCFILAPPIGRRLSTRTYGKLEFGANYRYRPEKRHAL